MAFDGLFTKKMIEEISFLQTARINKITQPDQYTLIFTIRANRKNQKLLISAHPNYARFHITEAPQDNPFEPPMFLRVLRKHLEGGIVSTIEQFGNDRLIKIVINNTDEIGDRIKRQLYIEIMGKHSNIILTDENNKILDSIKHLTPNTNSARTLMPGFQYELPPTQKKKDPFTISTLSSEINDELPVKKAVLQAVEGFSPLVIEEMLFLDSNINQAFTQLIHQVNRPSEPIIFNYNGKEDFYFMPLHHVEVMGQYKTLSGMLDIYYRDRAHRERIKNQSNDLVRHINGLIHKDENKLAKLVNELEETNRMDEMNLYGELITSSMYMMKNGMSELTTLNYYTNEEITIPLNPRKSPSENAQYYYKQYNRLKTRKQHAIVQIEETKNEIEYLETILMQLNHIDIDDLEDIRNELAEQNLIKKKHMSKQKSKKKNELDHYVSEDNQLILVGKNNLQNEQLTHKTARKNYLWFHTKDIPGSHVVIMDSSPTDQTIEDAAVLASYYSKSSQSTKVPVDFTFVKNVYKPNGAKPGFVTYVDQTTVIVDPDRKRVDKLKNNYEQSIRKS